MPDADWQQREEAGAASATRGPYRLVWKAVVARLGPTGETPDSENLPHSGRTKLRSGTQSSPGLPWEVEGDTT